MKVAILGCGPAGLLAAHGVASAGHKPIIYSLKRKSLTPGTMYVHQRIPDLDLDEPTGVITYVKRGTREGYAAKVYGHPSSSCSWDRFEEGEVEAWSMTEMYDRLWELYGDEVNDLLVTDSVIASLQLKYPYVISTIPATSFCTGDHMFGGQPFYVAEHSPLGYALNNTIVYDGTEEVYWYRSSRIFGREATEAGCHNGGWHPSPDDGWKSASKPIQTTCDCHREVIRAGRFGLWRRGVLSHEAFVRGREVASAL